MVSGRKSLLSTLKIIEIGLQNIQTEEDEQIPGSIPRGLFAQISIFSKSKTKKVECSQCLLPYFPVHIEELAQQ